MSPDAVLERKSSCGAVIASTSAGSAAPPIRMSPKRVSPWTAACDGVLLVHGSSSVELHIPGAASLANTASRVARCLRSGTQTTDFVR